MEELMEFFTGEDARRYRRAFSRVGFALLALTALPTGLQVLVHLLLFSIAPGLLENTLFLYLVAAFCTYPVGFPAAALVLLSLPVEEEKPPERRLAPPVWLGLWLLTMGWIYITNLITLYLMEGLSSLVGETIPNALDSMNGLPVSFLLVYSCVLAPVCEEVFFRGMLLPRLRPWGDGFALCASALLFALVHANLYQMLYAFAVGLVLGGVYLYTGRVRGCVLLHAGVNFVSAGLLPLLRALGQAGEHILSLLTLFSMLWAVYWTFLRGRERLTGFAAKTNWGDGETWGHFCVNFGMTLFVLALVGTMWLTMRQ